MKHCILAWSLAGLFLASSALAADVLVIRDDGYYLLRQDSNSLVKLQTVDQRTGTNPQPPTDPPTNPPPASGVTGKVEQWANAVGNKSEAALLGAMYSLFAREVSGGKMKPVDARSIIARARNVGLAGTQGVERWADFGAKVDGLMKDVADGSISSFFGEVRNGLAKSAGVDPGVFDSVSNRATGAAFAGSDAAPAGFDWTMIFSIIMQIIQLLRDLGIL